jgi:hypothetical protein
VVVEHKTILNKNSQYKRVEKLFRYKNENLKNQEANVRRKPK